MQMSALGDIRPSIASTVLLSHCRYITHFFD